MVYSAGHNLANQNILFGKDESIASDQTHPRVWADEQMRLLWNASVHIKTL